MSLDPSDLSSSVTLPKWMVWLGMLLLGIAGAILVGAWTTDRTQLNHLSNQQSDANGRITALEVKQADFIAMFNKLNSSIDSIERKLDLIDAHLERNKP